MPPHFSLTTKFTIMTLLNALILIAILAALYAGVWQLGKLVDKWVGMPKSYSDYVANNPNGPLPVTGDECTVVDHPELMTKQKPLIGEPCRVVWHMHGEIGNHIGHIEMLSEKGKKAMAKINEKGISLLALRVKNNYTPQELYRYYG